MTANRRFRRAKGVLMRGPTARLTLRELKELIRRRSNPRRRKHDTEPGTPAGPEPTGEQP